MAGSPSLIKKSNKAARIHKNTVYSFVDRGVSNVDSCRLTREVGKIYKDDQLFAVRSAVPPDDHDAVITSRPNVHDSATRPRHSETARIADVFPRINTHQGDNHISGTVR